MQGYDAGDANLVCWSTGNYTDECCCEVCEYREDCSGYDEKD